MFKSDFYNDDCEIFGCAYDCPFQNRKQDCPFAEIELLNFKEKVGWLKHLNDDKKELIIKHHMNCLKNREQKKIKVG